MEFKRLDKEKQIWIIIKQIQSQYIDAIVKRITRRIDLRTIAHGRGAFILVIYSNFHDFPMNDIES